jgi:chromosome partitioning protein
MRSLAIFSLKGGTGKTTLSSSLGWILAEEGLRVLLVDLDPQGHLTHFFKAVPAKGRPTLFQALIHDQPISQAIVTTGNPGLHLLPASEENLYLNEALMSRPWREWKLKDALEAAQPFPFDLVLMDVGGNLNLITYNALMAAKALVIPVLPDLFSYLSLKTLFAFLKKTNEQYQVHFEMIWVLINKINNHRPLDRENREALKKHYGKFLMPEMVREDLKLVQALRRREPITRYAPESIAARDLKKVARFIQSTLKLSA